MAGLILFRVTDRIGTGTIQWQESIQGNTVQLLTLTYIHVPRFTCMSTWLTCSICGHPYCHHSPPGTQLSVSFHAPAQKVQVHTLHVHASGKGM